MTHLWGYKSHLNFHTDDPPGQDAPGELTGGMPGPSTDVHMRVGILKGKTDGPNRTGCACTGFSGGTMEGREIEQEGLSILVMELHRCR